MAFPETVDDFEDQDWDEYTLDQSTAGTADFTFTTTAQDVYEDSAAGWLRIEFDSSEDSNEGEVITKSVAGTGLPNYPTIGDVYQLFFKFDDEALQYTSDAGDQGKQSKFNMQAQIYDNDNTNDTDVLALSILRLREDTASEGVMDALGQIWEGDTAKLFRDSDEGVSLEPLDVTSDSPWFKFEFEILLDRTCNMTITRMDTGKLLLDAVFTDKMKDNDILFDENSQLGIIFRWDTDGALNRYNTFFGMYVDAATNDRSSAIKTGTGDTELITASPVTGTPISTAIGRGEKPVINATASQGVNTDAVIATATKPEIQASPTVATIDPATLGTGFKPQAEMTASEAEGYIESLLLNGERLDDILSETVTYNEYTVRFRVNATTLKETMRQLKSDDGKYEYLPVADGSFRTVDTVGGDNTYILTPPTSRDGVRDARKYVVDTYNEETIGFLNDAYLVRVVFVPKSPREITNTVSQTAGADDWEITLEAGTIATKRVKGSISTTSSGEPGSIQFDMVLDLEQTRAIEESLSYLEGVRSESIAEGASRTTDTTETKRNTILIAPPQTGTVEAGTYIVEGWETEWKSDAYYNVEMKVSEPSQPLVSSSKPTVTATPKTASKQ